MNKKKILQAFRKNKLPTKEKKKKIAVRICKKPEYITHRTYLNKRFKKISTK